MAITLLERTQIEKVFVAFLNAAPSITYLDQLVGYAGKVDVLAKDLSQTDAFLSIYPVALTNEEFAAKFVANFVGSTASAAAQTYVKDEIVKSLNAGISRGDTLFNVVVALQAVPDGDATFGNTKKAFENKVAVADYYAITKLGASTDLATLQGVIAGVTPTTDVSSTEALEKAIAGTVTGTTYVLTTGTDVLTGTAGNDTFVGVTDGVTSVTVAAGQPVTETFGGLDTLDGGAGVDTLVLTNAVGTLDIPTSVKVSNIENLSLTSALHDITADVQAWTGLQTVTVENRGDNTNDRTVITTKGNVTSVSVTGGYAARIEDAATTDTLATVTLDGTDPTHDSTSKIVSDVLTNLTLKNGAGDVLVDAAAGARTLNLTVDKEVGVWITDVTATTVNVTATGHASTGLTLNTDAATALNIAGDKTVSLGLNDAGFNPAAVITAITSTNTAGVSITSTLGNPTAFTGGTGNDSVIVNNANTKAIATGAGDDIVTALGIALGDGGTIDGGDGVDTIALTASDAASLTATSTYQGRISNFEKVSLGQVAGGANNTVNVANLDNINYVISAGTAPTTGTAEVQTYTVTSGADANGGSITVGGVGITVPSSATAADIAALVAGKQAELIAANSNIASVVAEDDVVTVTYTTTSGDVALLPVAQNASGVAFSAVVPTDGTNLTKEQQTITVANAPTATGIVTIGGVDVHVELGETTAQTAARIYTALNASKPTGVESLSYTPGDSTVSVTFTQVAGNAAALGVGPNGTATFGAGNAPAVTDNAVAYVAPVAETQVVNVLAGTDLNGGEVVVDGARIALAGNLSIDQVGTAIAAQLSAIQAADANVANVTYNTATQALTFTFTQAAGNVGTIAVADNNDSGATFAAADNVVTGVAGTAAGVLSVTNLASGGTFELTGALGGNASVVVKDATLASNTSDVLNIKLNGGSNLINTGTLTVAGVETININATDSTADTPIINNPTAPSKINLVAADATKITVTGNHGVDFSGSTLTKVVNLDASGVVANVDPTGKTAAQVTAANGVAGAVTFSTVVDNKAVTITGGNGNDVFSAASINGVSDASKAFLATGVTAATIDGGAGNDTIFGSVGNDVLNGGTGNDAIYSSTGADSITLGDGNDSFVLLNGSDSVLAKYSTIADFHANTYGLGTNGAVTSGGATADSAKLTGDVIDLSHALGLGITDVAVLVVGNAADAQTFIQNTADANPAKTGIALDTSSNLLYIDLDSNGSIDSVIKLAGVSTINEAAFQLTHAV